MRLSKPSLWNNFLSILLDSSLLFILSEPLWIEIRIYTISYQNDDSSLYERGLLHLRCGLILKVGICITNISSKYGELFLLNISELTLNFTFLIRLILSFLNLLQPHMLTRIDVSLLPKARLLIFLLLFDTSDVTSKDLLSESLAFLTMTERI